MRHSNNVLQARANVKNSKYKDVYGIVSFMSSKDAPQKMQLLGTIKKLVSLFPRLQNAQWWKNPIISAATEPK